MPIYAIQVTTNSLQDINDFKESKGESGAFEKHQNALTKSTENQYIKYGSIFTVASAALALTSKGLCFLASAGCAIFSFDVFLANCKLFEEKKPGGKTYITQRNITSSQILGAFPDELLTSLLKGIDKNNPGKQTFTSMGQTAYISTLNNLMNRQLGHLPCLTRMNLWGLNNFADKIDIYKNNVSAEFRFRINQGCGSVRRPNILFIYSETPIQQAFSNGIQTEHGQCTTHLPRAVDAFINNHQDLSIPSSYTSPGFSY